MSSNSSDQNPGMVSGHAQYAKGAVVETIGSVTGSEEWKSSGAEQKQAAMEEMKEASSGSSDGQGSKIEELAGKAVGCEGMEKQGRGE